MNETPTNVYFVFNIQAPEQPEPAPAELAYDETILGAWCALTPREREVTLGVAKGLLHKEIAFRMKISPATVKTYLKNIFAGFAVHSKSDLRYSLITGGLTTIQGEPTDLAKGPLTPEVNHGRQGA